MATYTYSRAVFDVADETAAKRIILTPEFGQDTDQRWEAETPYLADLIGAELALTPQSLCIDYGCGIGRLSKALIERFGCRVLGVDISPRMRALAPDYVDSQLFSVVSPQMLLALSQGGLRASAAISVWVLQHALRPSEDVELLKMSLAASAPLFVLNLHGRAVPIEDGRWADDGINVGALLDGRFAPAARQELQEGPVPPGTVRTSWWATFRA
jgi:SAM-dependent methyltransferase